ncbi:Mycothiol acetyltransferase [bacterium HR17]|jgi:ribosomal protein S18 acetylase RimI-like enzyme|uniref:Mycothiol acetyltransferase n=1 Tax=Candidatus Fervidibacter japonicus TaxID=2035412 RepID=A0A2H5XB10_9BACT|nr:Mycothiol acetyltransferase [bacterium HR17]
MDKAAATTEPPFVIRVGRRDDLSQLVEVYRSGYEGLEEYAETDDDDIRDYLNWLYEGDPNGFWVAEANGELIGFVSVHSDWWDRRYQRRTAEIHELVVRKDWQSRGVGRALMMAALDYARAQGDDYASLWVGEGNTKAREWYRRLGFEEVGKGWGIWVRMVKKLRDNL